MHGRAYLPGPQRQTSQAWYYIIFHCRIPVILYLDTQTPRYIDQTISISEDMKLTLMLALAIMTIPAVIKVTFALALTLPLLKAKDPQVVGVSTVPQRSLSRAQSIIRVRVEGAVVYHDENGDAVKRASNMFLLEVIIELLCMPKDSISIGC